jgi:RNA polymerase sigma factor (sigma-70 family)
MRDLSELVEAAQSGNSDAYETLIQHFQQMAYATAYRYLRDHHQAQDLVQEAMIEAFVHLPQLKQPDAFPGWFRQIVFRQCTRVLRQATLQCTSLEAVSDRLLEENNPEEITVQEELQACVRSAVAELPQHERLVTELFYGCRYTYAEVSTFLKIPLSTVKKRLYSARQKLKVQLQTTLREAAENEQSGRRSSDGAADAEIRLVRWWNRLLLYVQEINDYWQIRSCFDFIQH